MDVDANRSGQNAKDKLIYLLKQFDFCTSLSVIDGMAEGEDPDSYVIEHGLESFLAMERELGAKEIKAICKAVIKKDGK